ncbi:MAG: hypothetical protein ACFB4J_14035 [Elainellaceae cyanobacterium]
MKTNLLEALLTVGLLAALPAAAQANQTATVQADIVQADIVQADIVHPACATLTLSEPISAFPISVEVPQREPFRCQDPDWDDIEQED